MKDIFREIQKRAVALYKRHSNKPLCIVSQDCCSEMTRLIGCWVSPRYPEARMYILKGKNVMYSKKSHDVLILEHNNSWYLIDPTIWQFFPLKRSIYRGRFATQNDLVAFVKGMYRGTWSISENVDVKLYDPKELEATVVANVRES